MGVQIREHYYEGETLLLKCGDCKQILPSVDFSKDRTKRFGFNSRCKACDKIYHSTLKFKQTHKKYWECHKQEYRDRNRERKKCMKEKYGINIKKFHGKAEKYIKTFSLRPNECMICGEKGIIEFHHPSYQNKEERKKGIFICKSCHRLIHSGEIQCPPPIDLTKLNNTPIILSNTKT